MAIDTTYEDEWVKDLTAWHATFWSDMGVSGPFSWSGNAGQGVTVRYSLDHTKTFFDGTGIGGAPTTSLDIGASEAEIQAILDLISSVANVAFIRDESSPQLVFAKADLSANGVSGATVLEVNGQMANKADVYISDNQTDFSLGSEGTAILLHEVMHALGVSHPEDSQSDPITNPTGEDPDFNVLLTAQSYNSASSVTTADIATPMSYDIAALQFLYGANASQNDGDTTYVLNGDGTISISDSLDGASTLTGELSSIWDSGGNDTYQLDSNISEGALIDLRAGRVQHADIWYSTGLDNAYYTKLDYLEQGSIGGGDVITNAIPIGGDEGEGSIENAVGASGDDLIFGNNLDNILSGLAGQDEIYGGAGSDIFFGYGTATGLEGDVYDGGTGEDGAFDRNHLYYSALADGYGVRIDLSDPTTGTAQRWDRGAGTSGGVDTFSAIHDVTTSRYDDYVQGSSGDDYIFVYGGYDEVHAGAGADTIYLETALGGGIIYGGAGADIYKFGNYQTLPPGTEQAGHYRIIEPGQGGGGMHNTIWYDDPNLTQNDVVVDLIGNKKILHEKPDAPAGPNTPVPQDSVPPVIDVTDADEGEMDVQFGDNPAIPLDSLPGWSNTYYPPGYFGPFLPEVLSPTDGGAPGIGDVNGGDGTNPYSSGYASPLTIDLDSDGIELVSLANSTAFFDFFGDTYAESTGWVGADDGFLVRDVDADGRITSAAELFGSDKPLGWVEDNNLLDTENGFAVLATLDENSDGVVDALDSGFTDLLVWQDLNQNGISDDGELLTLSSLGIESFDVANVTFHDRETVSPYDWSRVIEGNVITHSSSVTMTDSSTREIVDAWYSLDLLDTVYTADFDLNPSVFYLPNLRHYGMLKDFPVTLSEDATLFQQVEDFVVNRDFSQMFSDFNAVRSDVESILLNWAGVDLTTRTYYDDGVYSQLPEFYFLKALTGTDKEELGTWFDLSLKLPAIEEGIQSVYRTWDGVVDAYMARLVFQGAGGALFAPGVTYDSYSDTFTGTFALSQTAVTDLQTAATGHADVEGFWQNIAVYLDATMGIANMSTTETTWISDAVTATASGAFDWADVTGWLVRQDVTGTSGDDTLGGSRWDDYIDGSSGNDTLNGNDGDDYLYGQGGDDVLVGGAGNDILRGGDGSDTYIYESGHDVVMAIQNPNLAATDIDVIEFVAGITPGDVHLVAARLDASANADLFLEIDDRGTISIHSWREYGDVLDEVHFSDGTVYNLNDMDISVYGTDGDDNLGIVLSDTSRHFFDAGAGDDTINGSSADDTILFSAGTDIIHGDDGHDVLLLPESYTAGDVSFIRTDLGGTYTGFNDAQIVVNGLGTVNLMDHFFWTKTTDLRTVDELMFDDGSSLAVGDQVFVVNGTAGDDYFTGNGSTWLQDDIYMFGTGVDYLYDQGGTDTLRFEAGIVPGDISVYRTKYSGSVTHEDLIFEDASGNSFAVMNQFSSGAVSANALEFVEFDDGTVWDLFNMEIETRGTSGADSITSFDYGDLSANDTIFAYEGNDTVYGGNGADLIYGGTGDDYLRGDADNDTLYGDDGDDDVRGDAGDDTLYGGAGTDMLIGDVGNDTLDGGDGDDELYAGAGDDIYLFSSGMDTICDDSGTDTIILPDGVLAGDVSVYNSGIDDLLIVVNSAVVSGSLYIQDQRNVSLTKNIEALELFDGTALSLTGTNPANVLYGSQNNDALYGDQDTNLNDTIYGLAGNDVLYGYSGDDALYGDAGDDDLYGGLGDDSYYYTEGAEDITDEGGTADKIVMPEGVTLADISFTETGSVDLRIDITGAVTGSITIYNHRLMDETGRIETIEFSDSTTLAIPYVPVDNGTDITGTAGNDALYGDQEGVSADNIYGLGGNDSLYGYSGNDRLIGGTGNDTLNGGAGDDVYEWSVGDGNDTINETSGIDQIVMHGVTIDDIRLEKYSNYHLRVHAGSEYIQVSTQFYSDYYQNSAYDIYHVESLLLDDGTTIDLTGGLTFTGTGSAESVYGISLDDSLYGMAGNDTLYGYDGNDTLVGGAGNDTLKGGTGDDVYEWSIGDGNDTVYETSGIDQIAMHGVTIDDIRLEKYSNYHLRVHAGSEYIQVSTQFYSDYYQNSAYDIYHVESLLLDDGTTVDLTGGLTFTGTDGAESVYGISLDDSLYGMAGNDTLYGYGGNDTLIGGTGNDTLKGGDGDDVYEWSVGDGNDMIYETSGIDQLLMHGVTIDDIRFEKYGSYHLRVHAGSEYIQVSTQFYSDYYQNSAYDIYHVESLLLDDGTTIDLTGGLTFTGTDGAESVYGISLDDSLYGLAGNDTLYGYGGNDTLIGGTGNDTLYGDYGDDRYVFFAGDGSDTVSDVNGDDTLVFDTGLDVNAMTFTNYSSYDLMVGFDGLTDTVRLVQQRHATSSYKVEHGEFYDGFKVDLLSYQSWLWGTTGNDLVAGNSNDDTLIGKAGNDTLDGGAGDDAIHGGDGDDALYGDAGTDLLFGGAGADTFVFESGAVSEVDTIGDFSTADGDVIDISDVLSGYYDPQTDAITDFVQITDNGTDSTLSVDADGGADNFVAIATIYGVTGLTDEAALLAGGNLLAA